jgi:hypothetical protein
MSSLADRETAAVGVRIVRRLIEGGTPVHGEIPG